MPKSESLRGIALFRLFSNLVTIKGNRLHKLKMVLRCVDIIIMLVPTPLSILYQPLININMKVERKNAHELNGTLCDTFEG